MKGGVFLYPSNVKDEKYKNGKLRFVYEVAPIAYIAEKSGGIAITEKGDRILNLTPKELHERSTLIVGSPKELNYFLENV